MRGTSEGFTTKKKENSFFLPDLVLFFYFAFSNRRPPLAIAGPNSLGHLDRGVGVCGGAGCGRWPSPRARAPRPAAGDFGDGKKKTHQELHPFSPPGCVFFPYCLPGPVDPRSLPLSNKQKPPTIPHPRPGRRRPPRPRPRPGAGDAHQGAGAGGGAPPGVGGRPWWRPTAPKGAHSPRAWARARAPAGLSLPRSHPARVAARRAAAAAGAGPRSLAGPPPSRARHPLPNHHPRRPPSPS